MKRIRPIDRRLLRQHVHAYLSNAVSAGDLESGVFLDQDRLCAELGVSRAPVRDALIQLEAEGVVTIVPRRGVRVNRFGLEDIRHLYEVVGALESSTLLRVGADIGIDHLQSMRALNADMVVAVDDGDAGQVAVLNDRFHDTVLDLSPNATVHRVVRTCRQRLRAFPRIAGFVPDWEFRATEEHAEIIDLLEAGEIRAAADFLRDVHWSFDLQHRYVVRHYFQG
jgi:DNA-binding GntR family transcriptional regulator